MVYRQVMTQPIESSFLSCEKDAEQILKKLFVENKPYCDMLKRLLVINTKDCLDNQSEAYQQIINSMTLQKLIQEHYISFVPKIRFEEHPEVKSYIVINFDDFIMNATNPQFRDCQVSFDIMCYTDCWDLGNYRMRPLKIAGYIDGILNNCHLTGIGTFNFIGCVEIVYNENLAGYTLTYKAVHGSDDRIPDAE